MVKQILKKHFRLLLVALCALMASANLYAFDFEKDGKYYNINSDGTSVSITDGSSKYTGDVIIPSTVTDGKKTYDVTNIGRDAFFDCSKLTNITIPNSVISIGSSAFNGCSGLTSITIPSTVTSIEFYAFDNCSGLKSINVDNNNSQYTSENGILYDKNKTALYQAPINGIIGSFTIPNSVTIIESRAFDGCSGLTSITIPNSVTIIQNQAFWNCKELTSITIPNSVTNIEFYAFYGCTKVTELHIHSITPPTLGSSAFDEITNCTLYVPTNSVNAYKSSNWTEYPWVNIIGEEETGISQTISNSNKNSVSFDLLGRQKTKTSHGLIIVNSKKLIR